MNTIDFESKVFQLCSLNQRRKFILGKQTQTQTRFSRICGGLEKFTQIPPIPETYWLSLTFCCGCPIFSSKIVFALWSLFENIFVTHINTIWSDFFFHIWNVWYQNDEMNILVTLQSLYKGTKKKPKLYWWNTASEVCFSLTL